MKAMMAPPVPVILNSDKLFVWETNASNAAVGAVQCQRDTNNTIHPIQYASKTMSTAVKKYHACEREALAVMFAKQKIWLHLLSSQRLTVSSH